GRAAEAEQAAQIRVGQTRGAAARRVGVAVVGDVVALHADGRVDLADAVVDRAAGVVVVATGVGEGPAIGRVGAGGGVRGGAQVETAEGLTLDAGRRADGGVGGAVEADGVAAHHDAGGGLGDLVGDHAAGVVVVASRVVEGPAVAGGAGRGVGRAAEAEQAAQIRVGQTRGAAARRVGVAVVGDVVALHADGRVDLADAVVDRAAGVVVVA